MPHSYPGSELSVEQLVHALAQVLDPDSPLRRYAYMRCHVTALAQPVLQKTFGLGATEGLISWDADMACY